MHRRRRVVFLGRAKEGVVGMGFVIWEGSEVPLRVWLRARTM